MKLAIAFLLLGICLVPTNANYGRRRMTTHEGYAHSRMFTQCMQRWIEIEKCNRRCTDNERVCRQRAFLENVCFLLKLLAHDLQLEFAELLGGLNCGIHVSYVISAVQHGHIDQLSAQLTYYNAWNPFYKGFSQFLNEILVSVNVDLGYSIASVNACSGKSLETGYGPIQDVINVFHNIVGGGGGKSKSGLFGGLVGSLTGALGNVVGGVARVAGDVVGGLAGAAGQVVGGVAGAAGNVAGNLAGAAGQVVGGVAGAAGNVAGNLAGAAGQVVGGVAGAAGNVAGNLAGAAGQLVGGVAGAAGNAVGGVAGAAGKVVGELAGAAGGALGAAGGLGGGVAGGLTGGASQVAGGFGGAAGGAFGGAGQVAGGFGGAEGGLPGSAGYVNRGGSSYSGTVHYSKGSSYSPR
ncbi:glycine-rich cell wall structural protein-like isoform X7 [Rana temporaria]|uniref:glycine-rich cell wall structural protein-like isoform X6 n=1 Tax=Rana temporaria TaxID=8407 RepID=UPI001AAD0BE0|nr:glycine-rich cell wall structural protein-like isoform X6 [Rana temporaria]XP_040200419.1 glycine-rich cell wall structural protein-like isoform X7 [Rana temporaria]